MTDAVMDADRSLLAALARGDTKTAASLLDEQFNWIDRSGRVLAKSKSGEMKPLLGDEKDLKPVVHRYGGVVSVVVEGEKKSAAYLGQARRQLALASLSRGVAGRAGVRARTG
jgi:hypothetical protein